MTTPLLSSYRFMREHAGYRVGHRAEDALHLARAERLLGTALEMGIASVEWDYDDLPFEQDIISDEEARAKFESNEWTGPFACLVRVGDEVESLSGIVVGPRGTSDPYCRVIVAELAYQLEDDLRQVIGDTLDARRCCSV